MRSNLILIGGAEDKKGEKIILKRVLEFSKTKNIVLIPTASSYPREVFLGYEDAFKQIGINNLFCFDIRYNDEVDREEYFEQLAQADLLFFSGGDQVKLVETLLNTRLLNEIKSRFFDGTLTIAGTSAGSAAASDPMLYDGDYNGFSKGSVAKGEGFKLIEGITFDTHFLHRERIPRLSQFLISENTSKGIGIDEDTGIIISPEDTFEVIGSGMVTVMNTDKITYTDFKEINPEETFSFNNLRIGFLAPGAFFNMNSWSVIKTQKKNNFQHYLDQVASN